MSAQHTPGPWIIHGESTTEWALVTTKCGSIVANVNSETGPDATSAPATRKMPMLANARLIAAAPELLAACKALLERAGADDLARADMEPEDLAAVVQAERAVASAEGRT